MGNDTTIREAIKSIALNKVASNAEYSDKLRVVHGFVTAYNKDEGKSGTIDFSSMDGTVIIRDISLSSIPGLEKGIIQEPTIGSDVTVLWKVGTGDATIMSMSHVDNHTVNATNSVTVGVTEETPDDTVDYNEYKNTGNKTATHYTKDAITSTVTDSEGSSTHTVSKDKIVSEVGNSKVEVSKTDIKHTAGSSSETINSSGIELKGTQIKLGEGATDNALLGIETAQLLVDFITACSKITVPTALGTMPIINIPEFLALIPRCETIKSQIVKLK